MKKTAHSFTTKIIALIVSITFQSLIGSAGPKKAASAPDDGFISTFHNDRQIKVYPCSENKDRSKIPPVSLVPVLKKDFDKVAGKDHTQYLQNLKAPVGAALDYCVLMDEFHFDYKTGDAFNGKPLSGSLKKELESATHTYSSLSSKEKAAHKGLRLYLITDQENPPVALLAQILKTMHTLSYGKSFRFTHKEDLQAQLDAIFPKGISHDDIKALGALAQTYDIEALKNACALYEEKQEASAVERTGSTMPISAPGPITLRIAETASSTVPSEPTPHEQIYDPRGLLIFLDETEKLPTGPICSHFAQAIDQEAGPTIASATVVNNAFYRASDVGDIQEWLKKLNQDELQELEKKYRTTDKARIIDRLTSHFEKKQRDARYSYTTAKWLTKKISATLYLFIPVRYLSRFAPATTTMESFTKNLIAEISHYIPDAPITRTELMVGFKVNHMKTIANLDREFGFSAAPVETASSTIPPKAENSAYLIKELPALFCARADYRNPDIPLPFWSIYIMGHGLIDYSIVNMPLADFRQVLSFLETKIATRLLIYTSCYSAGYNAEIIYKSETSALQKTYPFAIITQATTEAPVYTYTDAVNDFRQFFKHVENKEITHLKFDQIAQAVALSKLGATNIAQIKLPGTEWFSVLKSPREVATIGSILAKTHDPKVPLDIATFTGGLKASDTGYQVKAAWPRALLLYAQEIPFEIVINKEMESIVSMIPGDAIHFIKKISSPTKTADELIDLFLKVEKLVPNKYFVIDSVQGKGGPASPAYKDVYIVANIGFIGSTTEYTTRKAHAFYYLDGILYMKELGKPGAPVDTLMLPADILNEIHKLRLEPKRPLYKPIFHAESKPLPSITQEGIEAVKTTLEKMKETESLLQSLTE